MQEFMMTSQQMAIYDGLNALRPAIAAFYNDGLKIRDLPLEAKSNLLGHLLREIDGGLRDIYKSTGKKSDKSDGHKQSIIDCFGLPDDSPLAQAYLDIAQKFNEYAHRSNNDILAPKNPAEIINLWQNFESVLYPLLGSFMGSINRLDVLLEREKPNAVADNCLTFLLENESKRTYFFQRLNKIGWLQSLYKHGIFDGKFNPEPVAALDNPGYFSYPYWYELSYVTRIASQIGDQQDDEWGIIANIINGIINYRKEDGSPIRNFCTDNFIIQLISYLPDHYLKDEHFEAVKAIIHETGTFLLTSFQDHFVPRFIRKRDKKHLLFCLDMMFLFKDNGGGYPKYIPLFDPHMMGPDIKKWNADICSICGIDGIKVLLQKLDQVKDDPESAYLSSIEESDPQNRFQDKYTAKLAFAVVDYAHALSTSDLQQTVQQLLLSEAVVAKRIAFHLLDKKYDLLKDLYWKYPSNPMNEILAYSEIYRLLQNHIDEFSEDEINRTIDDIDTVTAPDENVPQQEINRYKKSLAIALIRRNHLKIKTYFDKISALYPDEIEHPGYDGYIGVDCYQGIEIPSLDLKTKEIPEIIDLYKAQQPTELPFGLGTYNLDTEFSNATQNQIVKYTENIEELVNAPTAMLRAWIWGLLRYLDQAPVLNRAENVFSVINQLLQNADFWKDANNTGMQSSNLEYSFLSDLLVLIGKVNKNKITTAALELISSVLDRINGNKIGRHNNDWDERIQSIYNRFDFKLYDAMIAINFAYAKKISLADGSRWNPKLRATLDAGIDSIETNSDMFFAIGHQHHSLWYLDKEWMTKNIDKIFFCENKQNKIASLYGFMMYYALADQTIFDRLLANGAFTQILNDSDLHDSIIIKTLVVSLVEGCRLKRLDDAVIDLIINTDHKKIYDEVITYICNLEKDEANTVFTKYLWGKFIAAYSRIATESLQHFCQHSYMWLGQIENMDDEFIPWLTLSAENCHNQTFYAFVEKLAPFFSIAPQKAGEILLVLIRNTEDYLYHPQLSELVEKLYDAGLTSLADAICDECAKKRQFSLGEIYKRHHS